MPENNEQLSVTSEDRPQSSDLCPQEEIIQEEETQNSRLESHASEQFLQASNHTPPVSEKTQGVRPPRGGQAQVLKGAAGRAAKSGRRNDVHEYMRLRRGYV